MEKQRWNPGALLAPVPAVLVSCGTAEAPNLLTVAWTGIVCSQPATTYISLRPERHSYGIIRESGEFVINLTTKDMVRAVDFCGVRSGRDTDKFARCGLTPEAAEPLRCPAVGESPVQLLCKVTQVLPLGSHDMFLARIVGVQVDPALLDGQGKLHLDRANLLAYAHGEYFALGEKLGSFGYSVRKKPAGKRRGGNGKGRGKAPLPKGKREN